MGGDRLAVVPAAVGINKKRVDQPVAADVPVVGSAGNDVAVGGGGRQPLEKIAQHVGCRHALGQMRIQRLRFLTVAAPHRLPVGKELGQRTAAVVKLYLHRLSQQGDRKSVVQGKGGRAGGGSGLEHTGG